MLKSLDYSNSCTNADVRMNFFTHPSKLPIIPASTTNEWFSLSKTVRNCSVDYLFRKLCIFLLDFFLNDDEYLQSYMQRTNDVRIRLNYQIEFYLMHMPFTMMAVRLCNTLQRYLNPLLCRTRQITAEIALSTPFIMEGTNGSLGCFSAAYTVFKNRQKKVTALRLVKHVFLEEPNSCGGSWCL